MHAGHVRRHLTRPARLVDIEINFFLIIILNAEVINPGMVFELRRPASVEAGSLFFPAGYNYNS